MAEELHMSRVPDKAYDAFVEFAEQEFEGDYGMALRNLITREQLRSDLNQFEQEFLSMVQELDRRLSDLEAREESDEDEVHSNSTVG